MLVNGGDMFDLSGDMWKPNGLVDMPKGIDQRIIYMEHSRDLAEGSMPEMIRHMEGFDAFYSILGNADWLAAPWMCPQEDITGLRVFSPLRSPGFNGRLSFFLGGASYNPLLVSGISSIPALPHDEGALQLLYNNPWYGGVLHTEDYMARLNDPSLFIDGSTILITHMPALGAMDSFFHTKKQLLVENQGSPDLYAAIREHYPILHLTGHVHDAPMATGSYRPFVVSNDSRTVTVNPGGGDLHDKETEGISGVKIAVIDPFKLIDLRDSGRLTEETIQTERAVEILR